LIPLFLLLPPFGFTQQAPVSQTTLFVNCQEKEQPESVFSPVSLSEWQWRSDAGDTQQVVAIDAGKPVLNRRNSRSAV